MSKNLDESIAAVATPSTLGNDCLRCLPHVLHHLMASTKRVPARVTVIVRRSNGAGIWFTSDGINATAAALRYPSHTFINCSSVLLSTVSPILVIMSLIGFNISGVICFHSDRSHPSGPAAFFAPFAFIFFVIWSICSSLISICCRVSHRCWQFLLKCCHVGFASLSRLLWMSFHALTITS